MTPCSLLGRVHTWAFCGNVPAIRRSGWCCCNIRSVRFAAPADPPCCRFSSAHQRMLRYAARASSDVFLCSLRSSRRADTGTYPLLCFTVSVRSYNGVDARKYFGLYLSYTKKCLFCGIRTIPDIITKYTKHLPTMSSEQLVDHSAQPVRRNARRTVQPTPRVEQNPALLRCGRLLKSGRGLRYLSPHWLCVILHFSHDRYNYLLQPSLTTHFKAFQVFLNYFSRRQKFQHHTKLCSKCSSLLLLL